MPFVKKSKNRTPVGGVRNILTVKVSNKDLTDNYTLRWVEDLDGGTRIQTFKDAGYELVEKKDIEQVGEKTVNTPSANGVGSLVTKVTSYDKRNNVPVTSYLMKQKKEYYQEDQDDKQYLIDEKEASMRSRRDSGQYGNVKIGRQGK